MIIDEESCVLDAYAYFEATASYDHSSKQGFNSLWLKNLETVTRMLERRAVA